MLEEGGGEDEKGKAKTNFIASRVFLVTCALAQIKPFRCHINCHRFSKVKLKRYPEKNGYLGEAFKNIKTF